MDSRNQKPELIEFDYNNFFEADLDTDFRNKPLRVKLTRNGIELIGQYYAIKYQTPDLIIIDLKPTDDSNKLIYLDNLFQKINSEEFAQLRKTEGDIRIPIVVTGWHSTPIVYIKEGSREGFAIFDSANQNIAKDVVENSQFAVLTIDEGERPRDYDVRQGDKYSCHVDAVIFIRELTGKDENNNFIIPDFFNKLEKENRIKVATNNNKNLKKVQLPDRLLTTTQRQSFLNQHKPGNEIIHTYRGQPENIDVFFKRYPPDDVSGFVDFLGNPKKPYVSSYLREKGLKLANIIEIQFYLNQLKNILGNQFTETVMKNFIRDAKVEFKQHGHSFLTQDGKKRLYDLAKKYLEKNLNLSETKISTLDTIIKPITKSQK